MPLPSLYLLHNIKKLRHVFTSQAPHITSKIFLHMHPLKCYLIYKTYNINERLSIVACRTCQLSYLLIGLVSISTT